jgi:membrane fusion protein, multidrug efflux system
MTAMHGMNPEIGHIASGRGRGLRRAARRWVFGAGIALISGAAVWYGWSWWTVGRFIESTDDAYVGGEVTTISSKVAGFVDTVAIADNQAVKAGDLLVKLDDRDYRAQLAHAEASVAAQEATLANLEANARLQQAMIAQASAEIAATAAELDRAQNDVDRYRTLAASRYASLQRFQQADADYKKALAADRKAHAALEAAERQLDVIGTQKQQTRAARDEAVANHDLARLNLSYTEIRSPIDGVVGNRAVRVGAYATVGAQLLAVVPTQGLWIDANFKENQLAHIRARQSVEITADALPGITLSGVVASLAPATGAQFSVIPPENATGNFTKIVQRVPVRILLEGSVAELATLRPGLSVVARVSERPNGTKATREARR